MANKIDPAVEAILKGLNLDPKEVLWNSHGTWCMYHRAIEKVAAKAGITFQPPAIIENDGSNKCVAICVTGTRGDRSEWSIGEAAPWNNKNAYPWAMAEKRAKDRVVLKLIGLHGMIYSEDELSEGNGQNKPPPPGPPPPTGAVEELIAELKQQTTIEAVRAWKSDPKTVDRLKALSEDDLRRVRDALRDHNRAVSP